MACVQLFLLAIAFLTYSCPNPLPIIGNIFDLTPRELWLTAFKWARTYGPITHLRIFNKSLVFLNIPKTVFDLLDKRGTLYSDKPHLVMAGELCGCENMAAKLMQKAFGPAVIPRYHGLMQMESRLFLSRLVSSPLQYQDHIRRYADGLTLLVVYGHQVKSNDDPFLNLAKEYVDILANHIASGGGIWPVDIFPALKHLLLWFPGAPFKRNAVIWKAKMKEFVDRPYEFVKSEIKKGKARPSFIPTLLEPPKLSFDASSDSTDDNESPSSDHDSFSSSHNTKAPRDTTTDDHDIRWTANSMYSASIDTIMKTLSHFILAMVQHPHVLRRAKAELDDTLRWGVPVPLSLPHRLTQPDTYEGMYIPQGSLVCGNIWAIMRDPGAYQDPEVCEPGRWLPCDTIEEEAGKERDPRAFVFGFGRR
ncbi:cytochrome P450 [Suillus brevipes Sb2]|nr:cytochrome P450 [Suillus brevipes Sb2]